MRVIGFRRLYFFDPNYSYFDRTFFLILINIFFDPLAGAARRRRDMCGIEHGVDRDVTLALLSGNRLSPMQKGILRSIMAGAIWIQDRAHRARKAETALCLFCHQDTEDHFHPWWKCPEWDEIAKAQGLHRNGEACQWPACFPTCGIMPTNFSSSQTEVIDLTLDEMFALTVDSHTRSAEVWCDGRAVVYTDGACRNNQHRAIRRAAVGAFWASGHELNISEPLDGAFQTNKGQS